MKHFISIGARMYDVDVVAGEKMAHISTSDISRRLKNDDFYDVVKCDTDDPDVFVDQLLKHDIVKTYSDIHFCDNSLNNIDGINIIDYYIEYPSSVIVVTRKFSHTDYMYAKKQLSQITSAEGNYNIIIPHIDENGLAVRAMYEISRNVLGFDRYIERWAIAVSNLLR